MDAYVSFLPESHEGYMRKDQLREPDSSRLEGKQPIIPYRSISEQVIFAR